MSALRSILITTIVSLFAVPHVRAGIADSPLPVLVAGQTTLFLYSVPGVEASACERPPTLRVTFIPVARRRWRTRRLTAAPRATSA